MMTDDEIIAVVSAHKEGKKIEVGYEIEGRMTWTNYNGHPYNFSQYRYRVAPEPPKPTELRLLYKGGGTWKEESWYGKGMAEKVRVFREVTGASSGNPTVASDTASSKPRTLDDIPDKIYCP